MISEKVPVAELYKLELKTWWTFFKGESFAFKMICGYLFVEYVRPQSIIPWLDFLPWAQLFILGALVGLFNDPNKQWVKSPLNKWIVMFAITILWSCYNAHYPNLSYKYLPNFFTWFVIYFLIVNIVSSPQRLLCFLAIFCLASFKISFSLALSWASRGFSFTSWGLSGPPGFFQNSGELAIQMAVFWPLSLAIALTLKPYLFRWKYFVLILMPVTSCMVILGASSRGSQLALAIQFLFRFARRIFNLKVLLGMLFIGLLAWSALPDAQKQRLVESGEDKSSRQRLLYWQHGIEMMSEFPYTGVGYYNFIPYFRDNYSESMLYAIPQLAHNIFIQVGADLGWPGLLVYILMILSGFFALNSCFKMKRGQKGLDLLGFRLFLSLKLSLVGFVVAGQFVSVVYYPFLWIHIALVSVIYNLKSRESADGF